jgi:hypothetical protein
VAKKKETEFKVLNLQEEEKRMKSVLVAKRKSMEEWRDD